MGKQSYLVEAFSTAPPEVVFDVIADGPGWSRWVKAIKRASWEVEGDPAPGGVGAIRRFDSPVGPPSRERIIEFDRPNHLAYDIVSSPLPIRDYRSDVHFEPLGTGTRIVWRGTWTARLPMAGFLRRTIGGFARALAREAERVQREQQ